LPSDRFAQELKYSGPKSFGVGLDSDDRELFGFWDELRTTFGECDMAAAQGDGSLAELIVTIEAKVVSFRNAERLRRRQVTLCDDDA